MEIPQKKIKIELPYDLAFLLLGIYTPKIKNKNTNLKRYMHPYVHCPTLFIIANIWREPKYPSIYEWIKKMWYYIHNGMLILIK